MLHGNYIMCFVARSHITWYMVFPRSLQVGAPPEVVARLEEACASAVTMAGDAAGSSCLGEDPALDQFMEAYCEMLTKYEQELSKPLKEAMLFLQRIECQFKNLTISSSDFGDDPLSLSIYVIFWNYFSYLMRRSVNVRWKNLDIAPSVSKCSSHVRIGT